MLLVGAFALLLWATTHALYDLSRENGGRGDILQIVEIRDDKSALTYTPTNLWDEYRDDQGHYLVPYVIPGEKYSESGHPSSPTTLPTPPTPPVQMPPKSPSSDWPW